MFRLFDPSRRLRWPGVALAVLVLTTGTAIGAPFDADPEAAAALLEELGDRYSVLALSESYVLQPESGEVEFRSIEIKAGAVAVDGEPVTMEELRGLVAGDAETIFALSELGSKASSTEEVRRRIERLAEERRDKTEEIEELVRSRVEELESLQEEHLEALEEALDERREERRRRRGSVRTDTRISFGSSLTVENNETSQDVVVFGGSLDVEGEVRGDAVVVGGSAEIRGQVTGSVTAVGGSISLGPGARIDGDAISIGGAVHRDPTAEIYGEITEVSLGPGLELDDLWDDVWIPHWHLGWFDFSFQELFVRVGKTVVLGVLLLLLVLLFPKKISAVGDRVRREPWKAGIVGLGTQLLFLFALPVICMILLITIVGIPLALILAPLATLALVVLFLLGFAGVTMAGGRLLEARFGWRDVSPYLLVLLGLALIQGWSILGEVLGFVGGPIRFLAWIVLLLGFLIKYVAWTTGLGGILMHYLSPLPAAAPAAAYGFGTPGASPLPAPSGPVPPAPPEPADWDDTTHDLESKSEAVEEEVVDPDGEYLQAGTGTDSTGAGEAEDDGSEVEPGESAESEPGDELAGEEPGSERR